MNQIEVWLPYPPSTNKLWRAVEAKGKDGKRSQRNIKSEEYRDWLLKARAAIPAHLQRKVTGPYRMSLVVVAPDRRRRDVSNTIKPVEDCLVKDDKSWWPGVVRDDSDAQFISAEWGEGVPGVTITIEPIP